ncbi:hypothetical protein IT401_00540 [Candidatus Nomurabacteria bacterium]|nr:hypothetical protein [Candidatus Nomurabacteria bacterium]
MEKLKVYVGCGLTHAPQEYRLMIASFKERLAKESWLQVLEFVTPNSVLPKPDAHHIYLNDIHECVGTADAMIGDLTYPSTGLGWELGTAIEKRGIRTLLSFQKGALVSHLPIGAVQANEHVTLHSWESSLEELYDDFLNELRSVHRVQQ